MSFEPKNPTSLTVVGLDIGGSKTRGIIWQSGTVVADASAGSANVQNVAQAEARANLAELFAALKTSFSGTIDVVVAGSGGVDTEADERALQALIKEHVGDARIVALHDTRLILAAGRTTTGVAIIAGTGSAAWGINRDGADARAGGWGYLLGDEGSGYWFGREAVRHALSNMDAGTEPDELSLSLLRSCDLSHPADLIAHFHGGTTRRYWAAKSPLVFDAAAHGHEPSLAMITQAGQDLASLAMTVAVRIRSQGPFVLGSGLGMNQPRLQESFANALAQHGYTDIRVLDQDPIFGALVIAEELL